MRPPCVQSQRVQRGFYAFIEQRNNHHLRQPDTNESCPSFRRKRHFPAAAGLHQHHPEQSAFVANYNTNSVSAINTNSNVVSNTASVGAHPVSLAETPDGLKLYVANQGDNTVSSLNIANGLINLRNTVTGFSGVDSRLGGVSRRQPESVRADPRRRKAGHDRYGNGTSRPLPTVL